MAQTRERHTPGTRTPTARAAVAARLHLRAIGYGLVLLLALCAASSARAQTPAVQVSCVGDRCVTPAARPGPVPLTCAHPSRLARVTRGMAIFGVASAALTLSGAIALGTSESEHWERVGRSVMLGLTAVSTPLITLPSLIARRRARVKGIPALRVVLWAGYFSALITDGLFVYRAFNDLQASLGASIAAGALSAVTVLGYAYDAFQTSRQAAFSPYSLRLSPGGAALRVRF